MSAEKYALMRRAIGLSVGFRRSGRGGPFGAVIAKGDLVVGEGTNEVTLSNDPTAHAEIVAIRRACGYLGSFDLSGCEIFSSCEPCPMCLGAIYWARIDRIYFANDRQDAARICFDDKNIYEEICLPATQRRVPMTRMLSDEAIKAFEAWEKAADKIMY